MMELKEIQKLYVEDGKSLRAICRVMGIPEGNKHYVSRLLKESGIKIRKGKLGVKVGDKIEVVCGGCGKRRVVRCKSTSKPYSKMCYSCGTVASHKDNPRIGRAQNHYNWKGGININRQGYILEYIRKDNHYYPMAANTKGKRFGGYILQHRLVMARHIGKCLSTFDLVHHIDGNKQNNDISNLKLTNHREHSRSYSDAYQEGYKQGYADASKEMGE